MGHAESKPQEDEVQYDITIHTGSKRKAGKSESQTYAILCGDRGNSEPLRLHHETNADFTKGHTDTHPVYCSDLGDLWKIEIWKTDKGDKPGHWFVDKIEVQFKRIPDRKKVTEIKKTYEGKRAVSESKSEVSYKIKGNLSKSTPATNTLLDSVPDKKILSTSTDSYKEKHHWVFPCYRWIDEHEELFEGTSALPQYETSKERIIQRRDELEKKRGIYQWKEMEGLPQYQNKMISTL